VFVKKNYVYFITILYDIIIYFNRIRYIDLFVLCVIGYTVLVLKLISCKTSKSRQPYLIRIVLIIVSLSSN